MLYPTQGRGLKPDRMSNAVCGARELLRRIASPTETPRVPLVLRREAQALLKFFPVEASLRPVLTSSYLLRDAPKLKTFPVWPEHLWD